jgi:C-terminal processing protease CtpA/Prc
MDVIIKGINKGSFCTANSGEYISLAHFATLQSMKCIQLKESYLPDGYNRGGKMFIWLPTPGKSEEDQGVYITATRDLINKLVLEDFTDVYIDLRCNIGGVLSTFIDSILPMIYTSIPENYLQGKNCRDEITTNFYLKKSEMKHIIDVDGGIIVHNLQPVENVDKFSGKRFHILCNRYTMSSGEILCIIFRNLGHEIIGEKTRGLTNGCIIRKTINSEVTIPAYYLGIGNKWYK